jgi:undecaprenyl-diphosphatase
MPDFINILLPSIEHFHGVGYWVVFFAALLETTLAVGLILPGSTIILLLGALAARGYFDAGSLVFFAFLGAVIGDNVNYYLGKKYGGKWLKEGFWFLQSTHFEKARLFMDVHGARSVFFGRFIPSIKEIVPFIAGTVQMNRKTFLFWNVLGAAGWAVEWVYAGYFFGQSLKMVEFWLSRAGLFFAFLFFFSVFLYSLKWLAVKIGRQGVMVAVSLWLSFKAALTGNEHVAAVMRRHPRAFAWLRARFDTRLFSGLPLTLLSSALIYVLALFAGIVEDVITADPIVAVDMHMANLFFTFRTAMLTRIFTWITLLGSSQVIVGFLLALIALLWLWRKGAWIAALLLSVAGSELFTQLGKLAFHRPRPELAIYVEHSFSFPSGHSTIAVAFYGFAGYLFMRFLPGWKEKVNVFFATLLVIAAIGFSRLYLGVHYISDVWSGYLVGAMWLIIAIAFAEWRQRLAAGGKPRPAIPLAFPATLGLATVALAFYVVFSMWYQPPLATVPAHPPVVIAAATDVFSSDRLQYTETLTGERQEPVNFLFLAEGDAQLAGILEEAGWIATDPASVASLLEAVKALVLKKNDHGAPLTPSFWNVKIQDLSFAKVSGKNWLCHALHLRIWRTDFQMAGGGRVYAAMANGVDHCQWGVIPRIDPNLDRSRDTLLHQLTATGKIGHDQKISVVSPMIGENFLGDQFFTDGTAYVVSMKKGDDNGKHEVQ